MSIGEDVPDFLPVKINTTLSNLVYNPGIPFPIEKYTMLINCLKKVNFTVSIYANTAYGLIFDQPASTRGKPRDDAVFIYIYRGRADGESGF